MRLLYFIIPFLLLSVTALGGCAGSDKDTISATGTVAFIDLESGFYGIISDDGARYDPVNLNKEFEQDGLRVKFKARVSKDTLGIHMWGTLVKIVKIEKLK